MPGPGIVSTGEEYAGGGRGVEIEMIEICLGGSKFDGVAGSSSTSGSDGGTSTGAGSGACSGTVSRSGSVIAVLSWGTGGSRVGTDSGSN